MSPTRFGGERRSLTMRMSPTFEALSLTWSVERARDLAEIGFSGGTGFAVSGIHEERDVSTWFASKHIAI